VPKNIARFALATFVLFAGIAYGQRPLDANDLKLYSGVYSPKCTDSTAPRLRVTGTALTVEHNKKQLAGRSPTSMASYFGQSGPENFQTALLGDVSANMVLVFLVYRDKAGQFITLDGHPKVIAALGKQLAGLKYRRCGRP